MRQKYLLMFKFKNQLQRYALRFFLKTSNLFCPMVGKIEHHVENETEKTKSDFFLIIGRKNTNILILIFLIF